MADSSAKVRFGPQGNNNQLPQAAPAMIVCGIETERTGRGRGEMFVPLTLATVREMIMDKQVYLRIYKSFTMPGSYRDKTGSRDLKTVP